MTREVSEIFQRLSVLRGEAEYRDFRVGKRCNYKWELGSKVYHALKDTLIDRVRYYDGETQTTGIELMGLPIEMNHKNPETIKLWQEVEP